ncbi:nucleoside triphosphate pyrophosphohydrolase [Alkalibacter rhizosphaerae]|uniref:Nucleoside triphosphate pyrophosphohydrolase n=1 Tax=Alkalibacter rhizosphaerae TaxID=2815577 RepID=A0A975AGJ0_9FIRM|nr:nucleoside triphosphate pyrophosphohydrolase [Alkalibacter rhizosphaerae]QSX07432.1 nucleoside triphosphate pyrophosphohydrolase [Alkalibacter rhizosphaerae]
MKNTIIVVGLGPGNLEHMTLETYRIIKEAKKVFVRTLKHPAVEGLLEEGVVLESFDWVYDAEESFDEVYRKIAHILQEEAKKHGDLVYAVPGHPYFAEKSVEILYEVLDNKQCVVDVKSFPSMSFLDSMVHSLRIDPIHGLCMVDALTIKSGSLPFHMGIVVTQVYDRFVASEVKLHLMDVLGREDKEVYLVHGAGLPGEVVEKIPLHDLDRSDQISYLTSLYLPPEPRVHSRSLEGLMAVMETLRGDDGCPWDQKQTFASLRKYVVEEAYEVVNAIEGEDWDGLCEELGDLLLQVVFLSQIGKEEHLFDMADVTEAIVTKLINRHPHVFAQEDKDAFNMEVWERLKREEKGYDRIHVQMLDIPRNFPAYLRAEKAQKKASVVGFDWKDPKDALEKVAEELEELGDSMETGDSDHVFEEAGDLIFSMVNVIRLLHLDFREVLEKATDKFMDRFRIMEEDIIASGRQVEDLDLMALEERWQQAKRKLQ